MILWDAQHKDSAVALAAAHNEQAKAVANLGRGPSGCEAIACKDATLTVWSQGTALGFAGLNDVELSKLIKNWKLKNAELTSVELIGCDTRNNISYLTAYAAKVAKSVHEVYKDLEIKILPLGKTKDDVAYLGDRADTATFCYITATKIMSLNHAKQRLLSLVLPRKNNYELASQEMVKELSAPPKDAKDIKDYTVVGGNLNTLRKLLVAVA